MSKRSADKTRAFAIRYGAAHKIQAHNPQATGYTVYRYARLYGASRLVAYKRAFLNE